MNISKVSREYGISPETLRYYERIGLIPKVTRNAKGHRDYSEKDLQWLYYVRALRKAGIPVETLRKYAALLRLGDSTSKERKALLLQQAEWLEQEIEQMQETLNYLRTKIAAYEGRIHCYEQQLLEKDSTEAKR